MGEKERRGQSERSVGGWVYACLGGGSVCKGCSLDCLCLTDVCGWSCSSPGFGFVLRGC